MHTLKIEIFALPALTPKKNITIPGMMLRAASKMLPSGVNDKLAAQGIDAAEIVRLAGDPEAKGVVAVIEDFERGEKIVVSLV